MHQKVVLIHGVCGGDQKPIDGTLTVTHHQDKFPPTKWPVCLSHFKALVHLGPGWNDFRLEFSSPRLVSYGGSSSNSVHISTFRLNYLPLTNSPPLHLAIIMGSDSPGTFETTPEKMQSEGNDIDVAVRKYRMAGILWQAFTAEQMYRHGFGRRSFRFEEEWGTASLSRQEREANEMRNEVKVHVVRSKRSMAEWRDLDVAQQYDHGKRKGDLFSYALDDLRDYFRPVQGQAHQVAALIIDTQWDKQTWVIRGHAALGGGGNDIHLGIFGSHALHAYPTCIEDVVPALTDETRINRAFICVDGPHDVSMSSWAAAVSLGAHLHEVGHLFGCPHQCEGLMGWDYEKFLRTFVVREPFSLARNEAGLAPCLPQQEIFWHRLDALRFRSHPSFRLVQDVPVVDEAGVQVWATENELIVTAKSGITFIEIQPEGEDFCKHFIEFNEAPGASYPRQHTLTRAKVQDMLPPHQRSRKLGIKVFSHRGGDYTVDDIAKAFSKVPLPKGRPGFLGPKYGASQMENSRPYEIMFTHAMRQDRVLRAVSIHAGMAIDGLEFHYDDGSSQLFGKRCQNREPGAVFELDVRRGELLSGFYLRAGLWIDGIEILTSLGRRSGVFGNPKGGSGYVTSAEVANGACPRFDRVNG